MDVKRNGAVSGALLMLAGAAVGAGIAMLFAPQSGEKTRRDILRAARKAGRRAEEIADDVSRGIEGVIETVGESTRRIIESGKDLAEDRKKTLLSALQKGAGRLADQRERLARRFA